MEDWVRGLARTVPARTPEQFGQFMESEMKRYGEIVRISGAKAVE